MTQSVGNERVKGIHDQRRSRGKFENLESKLLSTQMEDISIGDQTIASIVNNPTSFMYPCLEERGKLTQILNR